MQLYKKRWDIEQVFQQVTETFALAHLIGSSPRAVLLQFAYCLLLYNLVQLIKTYVAADGRVLAGAVSTFYLFNDIRSELSRRGRITPTAGGRAVTATRRKCVGVCASCCAVRGTRSATPRHRTGSRVPRVHRPGVCTAATAPSNACWKARPWWCGHEQERGRGAPALSPAYREEGVTTCHPNLLRAQCRRPAWNAPSATA